MLSPRSRKKRRNIARSVSHTFGLPETSLDQFAKVCCPPHLLPHPLTWCQFDTPTMLIVVFGRMIKMESEKLEAKIKNRLASSDWRVSSTALQTSPLLTIPLQKGLQERLMICLLSPSLPAYLDGLNDRMQVSDGGTFFCHHSHPPQGHMEKHPDRFDIDKEVFNNPETIKILLTTMKELLTGNRGSIKNKVRGSFYCCSTTNIF
jgi:hypothetical protein